MLILEAVRYFCKLLATDCCYRDVEDIDLYAGGMSENHVPGGSVGPTFACIIAQQFRNLKVGDRFWHERNDSITGFTAGTNYFSL